MRLHSFPTRRSSDLLEHLRHLLLVQHLGEVPDSVPVTDETRERLRSQANQLGEPVVLRLIDLLAVAVDDARQGGDPRLPLELALVKVTRPAADLERESLAFRIEQLESRGHAAAPTAAPSPASSKAAEPAATAEPEPAPEAPPVELEQLQDAWQRTVLPAVEQKGGIPTASLLREAHPAGLADDTLTVEFPAAADFHRKLAEEPKNATLLADALYEVTGRRFALAFALGEHDEHDEEAGGPAGEEAIFQLMKDTFDARELDEEER